MRLDIKSKDIKISINTFGAYIETFTKENEQIFFPKVLSKIGDNLKPRGGMHPCLPNFGQDEISGLAQHGFARDEYWDVLASGEDYVDLKLEGIGDYQGVYFYINYRIVSNKLYTSLKVYNRSEKTVNLGPGFHPYFYCKDFDLEIENFPVDKQKIKDTLFLEGDMVKFKCNGKDFEMSGKNIGVFAIWTDFYGDYVCIEPTYKGKVFTNDGKDIYKLERNEEFSQEFVIELLW